MKHDRLTTNEATRRFRASFHVDWRHRRRGLRGNLVVRRRHRECAVKRDSATQSAVGMRFWSRFHVQTRLMTGDKGKERRCTTETRPNCDSDNAIVIYGLICVES